MNRLRTFSAIHTPNSGITVTFQMKLKTSSTIQSIDEKAIHSDHEFSICNKASFKSVRDSFQALEVY